MLFFILQHTHQQMLQGKLFLRNILFALDIHFFDKISLRGKSILSTFSIKPAGLKLSVFWHYIDENSLKTPPGHKKPFTAACHADIKNHLQPHAMRT